MDLKAVQEALKRQGIDGWLLYEFQGVNPLARDFLEISSETLVTRRCFYWIPASGIPIKIVHRIERHVFDHLPGEARSYLAWQELHEILEKTLFGVRRAAMEYSPFHAIPTLSRVDAGLIDLIRSFGVEVVSSGSLLQYGTCILDAQQLTSHLEAAAFLSATADCVWQHIRSALAGGQRIDEYSIKTFILERMHASGFTTEGLPICAVNAHSANPHFDPTPQNALPIQRGDLVLIDLWCKRKEPRAVYADITRVAIVGSAPTQKQQEVFDLVQKAQATATTFVQERYRAGDVIRGCDVDRVCRQVIEQGGYGPYFIHRTGHNIYTKDHGPGANIDSLETQDERELIPGTCFSIEPGIYLPGEFGIRLEYDIYLGPGGIARVTGGVQNELTWFELAL
jgi:Xaa-Pro dipeptidase